MPLTRLDNLISSKTGKYLYVSPDDFNATDALSNRGNSPVTPFKSIQRAFLEIARYSYLPGFGNDRFDQFSIMLMPGIHYIDNRPGLLDTSGIDVFGFDQGTNAWTDDSILDLSNPDNIYWKFNNTEGGAIIPRGSSLVGYDLRRTTVRPLYVPDPATTEREIPRSAIFNVTGGCYFWQFTIKDGQTTSESPLYNTAAGTGEVYYDPTDFTKKTAPNYSHHKLTVFEYADTEELGIFYRKIAKAFSAYQPTIDDPGEFDLRVQENRIVGPLSDSRVIESLKITDNTTDSSIPASTSEIEVTTKVDHGYFQGQFVAIANTEIDDVLEGIFQIKSIDQNDARKFTYEVPFVATAIGTNITSEKVVSVDTTPALGQNAQTLAEVDSVESASPYVFNVSIRSTWGICGIWANGLKATGFKSMVIAQYTGVSLQKDDRAFIRYDEYTNTWNQASLTDAFATVPYHTKGDSYWKDEWRNFHVRASEDAFIQNVSIFAVGFADHFLMESGGDMSITNSNSNFGNTSLHAIGFKGFSFNQDKGGYITHIIPPRKVEDTQANTKKIAYYTIDIQGTLQTSGNYTKLFLGSDEISDPRTRPAATIDGYRIGAKSGDKLYVKLDPAPGTDNLFEASLEPTGFVKYVAKGSILNPSGGVINSVYADAANLIESNRRFMQEEVFGYILEKYPRLQNISYVNPGLNPAGNRYFDARNLIVANRQEIVDAAYASMLQTFPNYDGNNGNTFGDKCKRDIGLIVDAVAEDLRDGGNANIIEATRRYFDGAGNPISNGLVGEEDPAIFAFNRARDLCKKAIANLLTVQADLYDPDANSELTTYGINAGYTGSAAEEAGLTTNGVTIDVSQKQDPAGRNKDARNRIVANRDFILDAALAEISVYHPDFYIPGDSQTDDQSRLADAFRLIRRNSKEIGDKALASIALNHPDFYIPGDQQTDGTSRYADAYRLIQQNKDQIVDTALAQIAYEHRDFYFPLDSQTDERSRFADAYYLIQANRQEIIDTGYANMLALYPNYDGNNGNTFGDKCKRDMGFLIDAVSLDLMVGGNKYSRKFISEYFDATGQNWISGGLQGETTESIEAFNQARDLMRSAVANQLSIVDGSVTAGTAEYGVGTTIIPNTNSAACTDVQSTITTLVDIITTPISNGNLNSLPAESSYISGVGESKCRRDIGYFVDAVALDLFINGNEYTWKFCAEYFTNATTQIANGLVGETTESRAAFAKAAEMMKKAVSNQLYEKDLTITADNAPGSAYGQVTKSFTPHGATYDPNTGATVLSIANHGLSVGDYITIATDSLTFTCDLDGDATQHTYPRNTDPAAGQYLEITAATTDTITINVGDGGSNTSVHTFVSAATDAVTFAGNTANQLIDAQTALCSDVQSAIDTLNTIVQDVFTVGNLNSMPLEINKGSAGPGETKCRRDIGYFIDAVSVDMYCAGNRHTKEFTRQYFTNATTPLSNGLVGEEAESITAFSAAISEMRKAVYNALYYKDLTVTEGASEYGGAGGNVDRQDAAACSDVQSAIQTLGDLVTDAIAAGNINGGIWNQPDNEGSFKTGESKCRRDIGHVVDAIAQDLWFGGNEYTIAATKEYFAQNALISNGVDNEVGPAITAFKRAADLMNRAVNNQYYDRDLTITLDQVGDPPFVSDIHADAYNLVLDNKEFIAEEAYQRMLSAYPLYTPSAGNTKQDCLDDVYDVLEEVMWDVKFGGNSKTYDAAKVYVTNIFNGDAVETFIDAERDEAAKVFTEVKNIAIQVLRNETVTVSAGNTLTQTKDLTIVDDWDIDELLPTCGSAAGAVDTLLGIIIQAIGNDGGVGTLTAERTTGATADPAYDTAVNITAATAETITINVGTSTHLYPHTFSRATAGAVVSGGNYLHRFVSAAAGAVNVVNGPQLTPTNATYNAVTGDFVMYFGAAHGVTTSDQLSLDDNSFTFKCDMDDFTADHVYPRPGSDSIVGQNVNPTAVTDYSITINVGASPLVEWDVTAATYDPASGDVVITIGAHSLPVGTKVKVKTESIAFKCGKDNYKTEHAYPRAARAYQPSVYTVGNCSDVLATIDTLTGILCDALLAGNLDDLPPLSNGLWDCANVRSSIENLFDILTDAIGTGSLDGLPVLNKGDFTINNEASKCFRDVSYIVDAVVNDLRLGGNINSIQAGEAYYVGNSLTYIDGEKTETLDAWDYVGQLATAAMRNFDFLAYNCSTTAGSDIVDVGDTRGIVIGMSVAEYDAASYNWAEQQALEGLLNFSDNGTITQVTSTIPAGAYVREILNGTQIRLGTIGSRLEDGSPVNAVQTNNGNINLHFRLEKGAWADTDVNTVLVGPEDGWQQGGVEVFPDVIADSLTSQNYRECEGTADAIESLVGVITTIINSGLGTVVRQEQTVDTTVLSKRATVFTIDTGGGASNPHNWETGTPVRLVPRPRFDPVTGKYVDVDKRLVRLPNGFETNRTYYVIAPGRFTSPENYANTSFWNSEATTTLMLATSPENAAAGTYIYASETDSIDRDVEIDIYQFILDESYDLHAYTSSLESSDRIRTEVAHVFDIPVDGVTPQKVFIRAAEGGNLPLISQSYINDPLVAVTDPLDGNFGRINPNVEFFVRYQSPKIISIHKTAADARANVQPISFAAGQSGVTFDVFANKRRTPMKFDPSFTDGSTSTGKWYVNCRDDSAQPQSVLNDNIFWRISQSDYSDRQRSTDMWYERLEDNRDKDDRTYKLRYVIPSYLENARDPINGFVLKTRTDDTRKLVPQKIVLKPVTGTVYGARFENRQNPGEFIGQTASQLAGFDQDSLYDPFRKEVGVEYREFAKFASGVQATIQSARYIPDAIDETIEYLELTVFDHAIDTRNFPGLRNEVLTTVKITAPQGGAFVTDKADNQAGDTNYASFTGNTSGNCNIHAYYTVNGEHYLIIKGIRNGTLEYSEFANTRFSQTQGSITVFADMLEDQDMGKSLPLKTHIRKNFPEYYYKQNGANVYTITPGDRITDSAGVEYYVDSVKDAGIIEDTFYIFGYETLQRRIAGQQDGIYYLTCLRGNVSPFPTGAGVSNNFRRFKFSQPVSKLYPLNYKNDPLWFQNNGTSNEEKNYYAGLIDPPSTFSAADNYVHGLVTVNDFKNSVTREGIDDLLKQSAFIENSYEAGSNQIRAQRGNATAGSEDRLIPIAGDSTVVVDQRYYVELRRPSIARAGNHTFEYLGFGPGNYSTGLPARQEVVLTPEEDFYAQSKKQDAGIVFYTGINSQGDLYIGNRRINAITGEETFIDAAVLADDGDEDDTVGGLVTTFDTPVTFNQNITVVGGDGQLVNNFESPVTISVQDDDFTQQRDALIIRSNVSSVDPVTQLQQDEGLDRTAWAPPTEGDIRLSKNSIRSAIFQFNARGNGQSYMFQTHTVAGVASNATPNQSPLISAGGTRIAASQYITYGGVLPAPGDVLFKGEEVGKNGSIAWILANYFQQIANNSIDNIVFDGSNVVKLEFRDFNSGVALSNSDIGITSTSQIRVSNFYYDPRLNLTWTVYATKPGDPFDPADNYCYFQVIDQIPQDTQAWEDIIAGTAQGADAPTIEFSNSNFKEVGVIGGEALRTETETIGDYKLGVNTIARSTHDAYRNAFVENLNTDPRANLDVVGNAYISGRKTPDYLSHTNFADRDKNRIPDALLVGGDSSAVADYATLRVSTETAAITESGRGNNEGKVGINATDAELDRALVVKGDSRFSEDARFERDIEVNGDGSVAEIRTSETVGTFNLITDDTFTGTINLGNKVENINIGNTTEEDQFIRIGQTSLHSNIFLGVTPDDRPSDNALTISKIEIGGAYNNNESQSFTRIKTKSFKVDGDFQLGSRRTINDTVTLSTTAGTVNFFSNSGSASIINFGLNASEINIAGQGGTTTINNQLEVIASATFNGNITLCGGVAAFSFTGGRGKLGSPITAHDDGILSDTLFNKNIDILNVLVKLTTEEGYNEVDTAGSGNWGGAGFQAARGSIGGTPVVEPQDLPALTGDEYYLPLLNAPNKLNGDPYFVENDYIIINSAESASGHPEIVQVVELTRTSVAPYYIKVRRQPLGTYTAVLTNHPDRTPIYKVNVQFDATWTEQPLNSNVPGSQDNVYLAEFGGSLTNNDYVIIDREDTTSDGIFDQGEVIKVLAPLSQEVQKFRISKDCNDADGDVFVVDSTTGDVTIGGATTINNTLTVKGGCGTIQTVQFTADCTAGEFRLTNVVITTPGKSLSDINIGDVVDNILNESSIEFLYDTEVIAIDTSNAVVELSKAVVGSTSASFTGEFRRNEKVLLTNGNEVPTFRVDTCTGTTHIGNHYGRIEVEFAHQGQQGSITNNAALVPNFDSGNIARAYSYWFDPQIVSDGGPDTTIRVGVTGSSGQIQVPVQSLGVGTGKFAVDDIVFVGDATSASTGIGDFIIGKVTQVIEDVANPTVVIADVGDSLGTNNTFVIGDSAFAVGNVVRRLVKHREVANVIDFEERTRINAGASSTYLSLILDRGYIVQQKLDYLNWVVLTDSQGRSLAWTAVKGRMFGVVHSATMNEQRTDGGIAYRTGDLNVSGGLTLTGGNFTIYDSINQTQLFRVVNDDGHADHQGLITWDCGVVARGDFYLFTAQDPENVITSPDSTTPSFFVDNLGNVGAKTTLTVTGNASATPSPVVEQLSIQNLGINGTKKFTVNQDNSLDSFGINNFYSSSGGRHTRYLSAASAEEELTLTPNIVYCVNVQASSTLILTLPTSPVTGDTVKIVEVGGQLSYNTSLVLRTAESSGVKIQGDATGTLLGDRITPYPSGELVVQTPNAAFTLVYLGGTDNNGQVGIPTSVQGWWLMEV